jgi:acyl-CoA dehydrogenase
MSTTAITADPLVVETATRLFTTVSTIEEVERAETDGWSAPTWAALAEAGFPWVGLPEDRGGSGGTLQDLAALLRCAGRFSASVPLAETALLAGWCLTSAGLELPSGPVTVSERPARLVDGSVQLDAVVAWARHAERIVTLVPVGDGFEVVSLRPEQVSITPGANLAGEARDRVVVDVALADTEHAQSDAEPETLRLRGALSRVALAAGALGAMAQLTVDYANERRQFGKPIATFQAVQHHLVTAAQAAVKAQMAADVAVRALATGGGGFEVLAARVVVDEAITDGTRAAHQAHGAMGVTREYPLHQFSRRLWSWRHEWGTTTEARRTVGRQVVATGADSMFGLVTR